jgi:hypothetical protein
VLVTGAFTRADVVEAVTSSDTGRPRVVNWKLTVSSCVPSDATTPSTPA